MCIPPEGKPMRQKEKEESKVNGSFGKIPSKGNRKL